MKVHILPSFNKVAIQEAPIFLKKLRRRETLKDNWFNSKIDPIVL